MNDANAVSYRVVGALGEGRFSPLLAVQEGPGALRRQVVLTRPRAPSVYAQEGTAPPGVVLPFFAVNAPEGAFAVWPFVDGEPLDRWVTGNGTERLQALIPAMHAALHALHASGRAHGAIALDAVRVTPAGDVVWVGARGGEVSADKAAFDALVDELGELAADAPIPAGGPGALRLDHPLAGQVLTPGRPTREPPPKARIAAIAALAMLLGGGLGWRYAPHPAAASIESAVGVSLAVSCDGVKVEGASPVWVPARAGSCGVTVADGAGVVWSGAVMVNAPGSYRCVAGERTLQCFGP